MRMKAEKTQQRGGFRPSLYASAFTLVELLVVIGIIVVLISMFLPLAARIRRAAYGANTQTVIQHLSTAIEAYNNDFHAYPGPLSNSQVYNSTPTGTIGGSYANAGLTTIPLPTPAPTGFDVTPIPIGSLTMSENLVLGLIGGLRVDTTTNSLVYDPSQVGNGPNTLLASGALNSHKNAYIPDSKYLSWRTDSAGNKTGRFNDGRGQANDTIIPEFVDAYPDGMPILYMRAKKGAAIDTTMALSETNNAIVTFDPNDMQPRRGQYDLHQIIGYTAANIGVGGKAPNYQGWTSPATPPHGLAANATDKVDVLSTVHFPAPAGLKYYYPYNAYAYFRNASLSTPVETDPTYSTSVGPPPTRNDVAFQKDGYILISAGPDRVYGTVDDLTNFGPVGP